MASTDDQRQITTAAPSFNSGCRLYLRVSSMILEELNEQAISQLAFSCLVGLKFEY